MGVAAVGMSTPEELAAISKGRVLMVGAGGIGCELLKTLVMTGFEDIQLIDLDTIETSNLNRQFLFRRHHVGMSKATVAREAALAMRPNAKIVAHHGNVKEERFGASFVRGFDVVLNGLDNMEARRYVNRLCLAAEVPLVESGTNGFLGQVTTHKRGESECFECQPKPAPKTYPVCTIRNTPDKPVHCVVWAKEMLFARLFGAANQQSELDEEEGAQGDADGNAAPEGQAQDASFFLRAESESALDYSRRIFARVYSADVRRLVAMEDLWKKAGRKAPTPMDEAAAAGEPPALGKNNAHSVLSTDESVGVFIASCMALADMRAEVGELAFDKEQDVMVDFVASAANLRMACFGIEQQSKFDIKGIAGNIVHAVATTNAVVSGLLTLEAIKIICGHHDKLKWTYVREFPSKAAGRTTIIMPTLPPPQRPGCFVCGGGQLQLTIDTTRTTLRTLLEAVVRKRMGFNDPSVQTNASVFYEPYDGLEDDEIAAYERNLATTLSKLPGGGVGDGEVLSVIDDQQDVTLNLVVTHQGDWDEEKHPDGFILKGHVPEANGAGANGGSASGEATNGDAVDESDDDDMIIMEDGPAAAVAGGGARKRAREDESAVGGSATAKASKQQRSLDGAEILID